MIPGETIICQSCGVETPKRCPGIQKYCPSCSRERDLSRKAKWQRENKKPITESQEKRRIERRELTQKIGLEISKKERWPIAWLEESLRDEELASIYRLAFPWTSSLLKNHTWAFSRNKSHIFLRQETRQAQDALILAIKNMRPKLAHNKIWVDILAQKPDHRAGDAINLIDRICDAIKKAIGIDDRWFCIRRLDWQIVKKNPMIYIGIAQTNCKDSQVCSVCGRILNLDCFSRSKHNKLGVGRECKECSSPLDKQRRIASKEIVPA